MFAQGSIYVTWSQAVRAAGSGAGGAAAPPVRRPRFCGLPGVGVRLGPVDGAIDDAAAHRAAGAGGAGPDAGRPALGELLVSGPMVSPGYTEPALNAEAFETDAAGVCWYRTRDCVEQDACGGLAFTGRADDLVKVGGAWVDIRHLEGRLAAVEGVSEACVSGRDAFVALQAISKGTLTALRAALPMDFALFVVPALPRRDATGKVDRQALRELVGVRVADVPARARREERLRRDELATLLGWYAMVGRQLGAAALLHAGWAQPLTLPLGRALGARTPADAAAAAAELAVRLGLGALGELAWRLPCLSYLVLSSWHMPAASRHCRRGVPLGVYGAA